MNRRKNTSTKGAKSFDVDREAKPSEKGKRGSGEGDKNKSKSTGKWNSIEARDFYKSKKASTNPKSKENRKDGVGTKDSPDSYITGKIDHKSAGTGSRFSKPKGSFGASDSSTGSQPSKSGTGFRTKSKSIAKPGAGGRPRKPGQKPKTGRGKGTGRGLK